MNHPSFWEQFREDRMALLAPLLAVGGPVLALLAAVGLGVLVRALGS